MDVEFVFFSILDVELNLGFIQYKTDPQWQQ